MVRKTFDRELRALEERVLAAGNQVEQNLVQAVEVLRRADRAGAQRLIAADRQVNEVRVQVVTEALLLIATQQPMAGDMRLIAGILEIAGELERIHDYVKGIARITLIIGRDPLFIPLDELPLMAEKSRYMLRRALDAFSRRDAAGARQVPPLDDEVDALFRQVYRHLIDGLLANPAMVEQAHILEWAAHNLERAADRVTNICEWVVYIVTGEFRELDSEMEAPPAGK